jgi:hypothetical protein
MLKTLVTSGQLKGRMLYGRIHGPEHVTLSGKRQTMTTVHEPDGRSLHSIVCWMADCEILGLCWGILELLDELITRSLLFAGGYWSY